MDDLRDLPAVDQLLGSRAGASWQERYGRPLTIQAVRVTLDGIREQFRKHGSGVPAPEQIEGLVRERLIAWTAPSLVPVINAAGVILHTNLGRAPLSRSAMDAVQTVALGYTNLEYDLAKGKRGSRLVHAEASLRLLTGAQDALVVNNNAAAVLLVLSALARRRAVVISRSQLVEIGGGFRVPDVMKQSGARLAEVGTTNRVHLHDYTQAIEMEKAVLVMRAHRSNFQIIGFTSEPDFDQVVDAAHQRGVPVLDDLGSGSFLDTAPFGLGHEPTVQESLQAGADLVCFSGDKLLGGPQAGIIVGRADLLKRVKKHPLARAVRADKLCLAALTATLNHYLQDEALKEVPVWQMISVAPERIHQRAETWRQQLGQGELAAGQSTVGGGSLPGETLPTTILALSVSSPHGFAAKLRAQTPPTIVRVESEKVILDPRTVLPGQDPFLLQQLRTLLT